MLILKSWLCFQHYLTESQTFSSSHLVSHKPRNRVFIYAAPVVTLSTDWWGCEESAGLNLGLLGSCEACRWGAVLLRLCANVNGGGAVAWRRWSEVRWRDGVWLAMTESVTVTWAPRGPAAPQPEFRREKQSLTLSHWFSSFISSDPYCEINQPKDCNDILFAVVTVSAHPFAQFACLLCHQRPDTLYRVITVTYLFFLFPPRLLNCLLISWHRGLFGNTDGNQCCVIMNKSAVSRL